MLKIILSSYITHATSIHKKTILSKYLLFDKFPIPNSLYRLHFLLREWRLFSYRHKFPLPTNCSKWSRIQRPCICYRHHILYDMTRNRHLIRRNSPSRHFWWSLPKGIPMLCKNTVLDLYENVYIIRNGCKKIMIVLTNKTKLSTSAFYPFA